MLSSDRPSGSNAKRERRLTGPAVSERRRNIWLRPEPARKGCLGSAALYVGNTMLKIPRQTKDDGVATANISRLTNECSRFPVTYLQHTAGINLPAQVETQADKPAFTNVVVPGIVMSLTRVDAINSALETVDSIAAGYVLDELEKLFVVHQE